MSREAEWCDDCNEQIDAMGECECERPLIIHDECGLDIELCVCPDAPVYWDNEKKVCVVREKGLKKRPDH